MMNFDDWYQNKISKKISNEIIKYKDIKKFLIDTKSLLFPGFIDEVSDVKEYIDKKIEDIREDLCILFSQIDGIEKIESDLCFKELATKFLNGLPEIDEMLKKDIDFFFDSDPAADSKKEIIITYPGFSAIVTYRIAHHLYNMGIPVLPRAISEYAHSQTGIDINPGAEISAPLFIDHGTGVVIGQTAVIGKYVKIYQGVTLGALSLSRGHELKNTKRHPTIKDNVTIYANASILGGETVIEEGVTVGANSFITSSVAKNVKLKGAIK